MICQTLVCFVNLYTRFKQSSGPEISKQSAYSKWLHTFILIDQILAFTGFVTKTKETVKAKLENAELHANREGGHK